MALRLEDHVFKILENQKKLLEFLGEYSWDLDLSRGSLTFSQPGKMGLISMFNKAPEVIAERRIQLFGTRSESAQSWLWAWANEQSQIPDNLLRGVEQIRHEGHRQTLPQFTNSTLSMPEDTLAHELSIICAGHLGYFCPFACPYDGGVLFTAIESLPEEERIPRNGLLVTSTLQFGISTFSFQHKPAVLAYLGEPKQIEGDDLFWDLAGEPIRIRFDELGRIAEMNSTLSKA